MASPDITRKTDAELARFCAVHSSKLTRLQRQIAASPAANPSLDAEFDQTAEPPERSDQRTPGPH
jgi:hypothetical protein